MCHVQGDVNHIKQMGHFPQTAVTLMGRKVRYTWEGRWPLNLEQWETRGGSVWWYGWCACACQTSTTCTLDIATRCSRLSLQG